ncbi:hypothetical protein M409DRAFT_67854 [Zasmidium cellare ATCC 36951]|uniref:Cytochrome P450 n=1 Tax=Zasmidium cellare ATCC 36951 TaxID=1080233 RepID=A0A6A6CB79_ZASCE|nr:uncharacterized protein M409DRAFT_67854 [Zasmidium cellare ATCC 36951]KAF2164295.1 hypothetical protein M409DRAFT_67854 [Zasmidium cellare ATCC 36951]
MTLLPSLTLLYYVFVPIASSLMVLVLGIVGLQLARVYLAPIPANLPWAGLKGDRFLPKLRATLRELSVKRVVIEEGYEKYSKHEKPFVLPSLHWPIVVLPASKTRWIISQPDSVLSTIAIHDDLTGPQYFGHGPDAAACHDFSIITRDLTRNIGKLTSVLLKEIQDSCRRQLDSDEWSEVEPASVMKKVAGESVSRAVVGKELAHHELYLERLHAWEYGFGYCGLIFGQLCPRWLKPLAGRVLMLPVMLLKWRVGLLVYPKLKQRISRLRESDDTAAENDLMQWVIESAERDPDPRARNLDNILGRTMMYNMFAQHTTQHTAATVLFDLLSYPSGHEVLPALIEEAKAILPKLGDDPYATRDMVKLDSTIRESMRLNPMFAKGIPKEVVKPGGLTTPDGLFLPQGCHVSTASASFTMRDAEFYEDGNEFKPLRFCEVAVELGTKQKAASQVDEQFLAFSLGKHACPGRFFAAHMLKLMLGHVLVNYEFEMLQERPEFVTFGDLTMPPSTKVKVRRRRSQM